MPRTQATNIDQLVRTIATKLKKELNPTSNVNAAKKRLKEQVFRSVSTYYDITIQQLKGAKQRGIYTEARVMTIILLNKHCKMSASEIGPIFKLGSSVVNKRILAFKKAKTGESTTKFYSDPEFIGKFDEINTQIIKHKKFHNAAERSANEE